MDLELLEKEAGVGDFSLDILAKDLGTNTTVIGSRLIKSAYRFKNAIFFGIVIEILQIDDSQPAINFKLVVLPNEWKKDRSRRIPGPISKKSVAYRDFFQKLIDELRDEHHFTGARIAQPQNWYAFASGHSGIIYGVAFG